jgi:hypothetical protein
MNLSSTSVFKHEGGENVYISTKKDDPSKGKTLSVVIDTLYDNERRENVCLILPLLYQNPQLEWVGYEAEIRLMRPESSLIPVNG